MNVIHRVITAALILATASCGRENASDADAESNVGSARNRSIVPKTDWNALFYSPSQTDAALGKLGFGSPDYKAFPNPPPAFMGTISSEISEIGEGLPNAIHISTYGQNADVLDEIDFILGIYSPSLAGQSKVKFSHIVNDFMEENQLAGRDLVNHMIASEKPDEIMVGNAVLTVRLNNHGKPGSGKHDLELIFHRADVTLQED